MIIAGVAGDAIDSDESQVLAALASFRRLGRIAAFYSLLKIKLRHDRLLTWGEDHFDRISKPCPVKIFVAAWDVK